MPDINISISRTKFLPCYWHLLDDSERFDIDFVFGGRDSGKSRHVAMQLIVECLKPKVFRCLLIRKVLNTIRDSQYSLIQSIIAEWGLTHLFRFNSSRLEIMCVNGNGFFGRGLDDVGRIKSFNNPSHSWCEEGSQMEREDFVVILTSMRNNFTDVKTFFTFNPECEMSYIDFWLYQDYFMHTEDYNFTWVKKIEFDGKIVEYKIRATHTTYKDNPYCTPQRQALLEGYKNSKNNEYWYTVYTCGEWGYRRPGGTFYKCFETDKHTLDFDLIPNLKQRGFTYHVVCDNNVTPYVSVQIWVIDAKGKALLQIDELPCTHPDNTAAKAAKRFVQYLERDNYNDTIYVYGDPSANARSTTDDEGRSFFDKFIGVIQDSGYNYVNRVGKSAPSVSQSGAFINEIFETNYLGWKIYVNKTCRKSIEDMNMCVESMDGGILKKRITDKDTGISYEKYGHFVDCSRYFITTVLKEEYSQFLQRRRGLPNPGGTAKVQRVKKKLG